MKGTELFRRTIKDYLDKRAADDELFAVTYAKPNKTLDECVNYIFQQVKESGCCGFADEEIYGMAVHYYDEDSIKDVPETDMGVVVNHRVELTDADKAEAKRAAMEELQRQYIREANTAKKVEEMKKEKAKKSAGQMQTGSLFDL